MAAMISEITDNDVKYLIYRLAEKYMLSKIAKHEARKQLVILDK